MSTDISRQRFNPLKDFAAVLQQQGRVQLDADWNEFVEILDRRFRAETTDIIGRCVVPRETPDGFKITVSGNNLNIGHGRIYVDGLLAENHGGTPDIFDAVLGELHGTNPISYLQQPYWPSAKSTDLQGGPLLVYLDVWQREVTFIEDSDLVEKAVGVDTTARLQTVWQVRVLPNIGNNATCGGEIPEWTKLIAPSAGRLSTDALGVAPTTDPCLIPPAGGYRGLENQLYRVEIHSVDPTGKATFKWSRDGASVVTNIRDIDASSKVLTVDSVGRDSVLCFKVGDWVELTDDIREFDREPGIMRKVLLVGEKSITLDRPLTVPELPDKTQNARLKRWDQSGKVLDTNNQTVVDLDASTDGVIPVPVTAPATSVLLENGVQVTFSLDPAGGRFHVGNYWVFAARTADASVEKLVNAAPRGIHHHFGRLAIVTFPGPTSDCRVLWPSLEECCDCSVCVSAESHNNGTFTIQQAIAKIKNVGGTICLGPGLYQITSKDPVTIDGARSIRLKGQGWATILFSFEGPGVIISNSLGVTLQDLAIVNVGRSDSSQFALDTVNSVSVTVERCAILRWNAEFRGPAIRLEGFVLDTGIRENVIFGAEGIAGFEGPVRREGPVEGTFRINLTALLRIDDNFIFALDTGISFPFGFYHLAENRIAGNYLAGCKSAGMAMQGTVAPDGFFGSRLDLHGNALSISGHGIVIATSQTRITDNDISANPTQTRESSLSAGVLLEGRGINQCQILENRINGMSGFGINIEQPILSAMIKQNVIDHPGRGGIVADSPADTPTGVLVIENNQIANVAAGFAGDGKLPLVGIGVSLVRQITIGNNTVINVGLNANVAAAHIAGISVANVVSARIAGNSVSNIAPSEAFAGNAEGIFAISLERLDILDNYVKRSQNLESQGPGRWLALLIGERAVRDATGITFAFGELRFVTFSETAFFIRRGRETIGVRGNLFDAYGAITPVEINRDTAVCLFNDNRCLFSAENVNADVIRIKAQAVVLSGNYYQRTPVNDALGIELIASRFTVLGNLGNGPIKPNGSSLQAPWNNLNV